MLPIGRLVACALLAVVFSRYVGHAAARNDAFLSPGNSARIDRSLDVGPVAAIGEKSTTRLNNEFEGRALREGRTFGHKRIQFLLMPMMYKMGAMMTLLTVLTVISLKGLLIGTILLVLKLSTILAKFFSGWNSHPQPAWPPAAPQPVHVHVHNTHAHGQPYSGWAPPSGPEDDHYYYKG